MKQTSNIGTYFPGIPRMKLDTLVAEVIVYLNHAEFLADLYRTPNSGLDKLKQRVDTEWRNLSFLNKILTFLPGGDLINFPKDVRNEMKYRLQNTRDVEEWKQVFINLANRYPGKEFEEVRDYILNDAMNKYKQTRQLS